MSQRVNSVHFDADEPYVSLDDRSQMFYIPPGNPYENTKNPTITPQEIFYDYDDVIARLSAQAEGNSLKVPNWSTTASSETDSGGYSPSYASSAPYYSSVSNASSPAGGSPAPSAQDYSSSSTIQYQTNDRLTAPKKRERAHNSGKSKNPTEPPTPRLRKNAQHSRQIDLSSLDLTSGSMQCTYVHPIWSRRCPIRKEYEIDWTRSGPHWNSHIIKEYQLMRRNMLRVGEGTIISSSELFEHHRNQLVICDICEDVLSRKDALIRHKVRVHKIGVKNDGGIGASAKFLIRPWKKE